MKEGDYFALKYGEIKFGRLNKGLCRQLTELTSKQQVRSQAYISANIWNTKISGWNNQGPHYITAEVNIYGSRADAKEIGSILSRLGVFLQMPRHGEDNVEYYNPHILRIEGFSELASFEQPRVYTRDASKARGESEERESQSNDTAVVDSILDSLSHHNILQEIAIVPDIRSTLLPHQKEAVDFIFQRETEQISSDLSLWKYNDMDADEPFYQHVFSGAKRPERAEARGGIIADEMGLGKSLVILSTIAGSLDRAKDFAAAENQQLSVPPMRKTASSATLILAPSSLLIDNWVDEIRKHTNPGTLPFHKHLGPERHKEIQLLYELPIVFTTYATVAAEFRRGDSTLAKINWFRIVLDEAHDIRNRSTKQFQAVASIPALHRWCLTGTPIQNSLEDLGALVSFLGVPILEKAPTFRKFITNPITSKTGARFQNLQILLQTVCLRRTRQLLDLPEPVPKLRRLPLTGTEQAQYHELLAKCKESIDMAVSRRGKSNVNSAFLESLLKLRLFCNNGRSNAVLELGPKGLPVDHDEALIYLQQQGQNVCAYCSGTIYFVNETTQTDGGVFMSSCCHLVCHNCLFHHRTQKQSCPACASETESTPQAILASSGMHTDLDRGNVADAASSTQPTGFYPSKLLALLSDIRQNSTHKSIIFSCWKKTLDLVGELLQSQNIRYDVIHGSLRLTERVKVLKDFRSPNGSNILLMTLGTGAVGLNLAIASRVYLLEPQWNPSIESQAIGRALRLGQTAQVVIIRYVMIDTIEENNVLFRQRRKLELAGSGFNKGKDMPPERLQALRDIFGFDKNFT
ncbi:SNF2 family N-terminal domain-containing protein [Hypoxylon rubiginosum]|uniref:SNF2 family N-terminal domain-containing protein n=1 Tax=Hypoxylon rubiginosum TaxID=110542 RepID=A0ACC0DC28_9PEZI|nr:SNF2 family N-terminal domain-containing protein [Hypoxylon rubiginosum]